MEYSTILCDQNDTTRNKTNERTNECTCIRVYIVDALVNAISWFCLFIHQFTAASFINCFLGFFHLLTLFTIYNLSKCDPKNYTLTAIKVKWHLFRFRLQYPWHLICTWKQRTPDDNIVKIAYVRSTQKSLFWSLDTVFCVGYYFFSSWCIEHCPSWTIQWKVTRNKKNNNTTTC